MNKTPFMPPLNSWWRTTAAVILEGYRSDNNETLGILYPYPWLQRENRTNDNDWVNDYHAYKDSVWPNGVVIPAGTVFSFNRYHASNSGDVTMTLQFIASPDPRLTPKKRGGTGKGAMRLYVNLDQFNKLGEMEDVTDQLV